MSLLTALKKHYDTTVRVTPRGSFNTYNDPTYTTASQVSYPARLEFKHRLVKGPDGREVLSRGRVFLAPTSSGGQPSPSLTDQVLLASSSAPPVVAIEVSTGPTVGRRVVVHFG